MGDFILVLNASSSSLKFTLFECFGEVLRTAYGGQIEGLFTEPLFKAKDAAGRVAAEEAWPAGTPFGHDGALEALFAWGRTILGGGDRIAAVGHRVRAWVIPTDEELMIARHTQQAVLAKPS